MPDTPTPSFPPPTADDHAALATRLARLEEDARDNRDHRTKVQTLLGLAGAAALAVTFGAVSVRDITLTTGGRLEALQARVDRVEAGAARRDGDDRTTREAIVRLEATLEALRSSLATRLDSIDQRLQRGPSGR